MCRFLETIKLKDGEFYRLDFHQQRVKATFRAYFPEKSPFQLIRVLESHSFPENGLFKCRIVYDSDIQMVEILPYQMRPIKSLKMIYADIPYTHYKSEDRKLYNDAFALKDSADDVLIVRDGLITDTSYCNVALFDGNEWLTPRIPLLTGTQRNSLINNKLINEADIFSKDLLLFEKIRLFNAMIEFGDLELSVSQIIP